MDIELRDKFIAGWHKHFDGAELPITFYYTNDEGHAALAKPGELNRCIIGALAEVRKGRSFTFNSESIGCPGGRRYTGYAAQLAPNFEYFLSCGIPGKVMGERYKKSPELVKEAMAFMPAFKAPARFMVWKQWDNLDAADKPAVAVFFASPDALSGLFTLANYDEAEPNGVFAPFGSGCSSMILYPYLEQNAARPRCVVGLFDVSARPFVPPGTLTFAVPLAKLERMAANMGESFLITPSWLAVRKRIAAEHSA